MIHTQHFENRPPHEAVKQFLASDEEELYFAVSEDFYEIEAQDRYEDVYAAYEAYYQDLVATLMALLGEPTYRGTWEDDDYPEWAVGEQVCVWAGHEPPVYLRLHHEDREVPILIALSRIEV